MAAVLICTTTVPVWMTTVPIWMTNVPILSTPSPLHLSLGASEPSCQCICRAVQKLREGPNRKAAVKVMRLTGSDGFAMAKHEEAVLSDLGGKAYVPAYYGAQYTPRHAYLIME